MKLNKSKGRMFPNVDYTGTYFQGCDHGCEFCLTLFLPWGSISHKPRLVQKNENELLRVRDATIFLNSVHDTFARCIPSEWIRSMLRWIRRQDKSLKFYIQSQNIDRAVNEFIVELLLVQDQVILGTTIQTDDEELMQAIQTAPSIYSRYMAMLRLGVLGFDLRLSLEPLFKFNLRELTEIVTNIKPTEVMIGLDNYAGRHKLDIPQPNFGGYLRLYDNITEAGIKVIEKDSITKWRERHHRPRARARQEARQ